MIAADLKEREAVEAFLSSGTEDSFRGLYEALFAKLVRYFMARGLAATTAEELTQDVLMTVYQHADSLRNKDCFFGWLFQIAGNCHLQHLRRLKRDIDTVALAAPELISAKRDDTGRLDRGKDFLRWMDLLEPMEREIMMLRYVEELGYQEIATALAVPLGTVKWKIFNAKQKLSAQLAPHKRAL